MNFRKLIIFIVTMSCMTMPVQSASHEKKVLQDIKAKIEKDNKVSQLDKDKEDDLPLNNPFAGDGANKKKRKQHVPSNKDHSIFNISIQQKKTHARILHPTIRKTRR